MFGPMKSVSDSICTAVRCTAVFDVLLRGLLLLDLRLVRTAAIRVPFPDGYNLCKFARVPHPLSLLDLLHSTKRDCFSGISFSVLLRLFCELRKDRWQSPVFCF